MASPINISVKTLTEHQSDTRFRSLQPMSLALVICSGVAGVLDVSTIVSLDNLTNALAFSLGLALYVCSHLFVSEDFESLENSSTRTRQRGQIVSRNIYLILYGLFGLKELYIALTGSGAGVASSQLMHGLWPYLAGGCLALLLAKSLIFRSAR